MSGGRVWERHYATRDPAARGGDGADLFVVIHEEGPGRWEVFTQEVGPFGYRLSTPKALRETADGEHAARTVANRLWAGLRQRHGVHDRQSPE